MYDQVSKKATYKYRAKFDTIQFRVDQGKRDIISEHAKRQGESMNAFINRAIATQMEIDDNKQK